jgi:hypothetical protein
MYRSRKVQEKKDAGVNFFRPSRSLPTLGVWEERKGKIVETKNVAA